MSEGLTVVIPEELEPYLIGLWKFRAVTGSPTWCTTFMVCGKFFDTFGEKTPQLAIKRAIKELKKARKLVNTRKRARLKCTTE